MTPALRVAAIERSLSSIPTTRRHQVAERAEQVPLSMRNNYLKAAAGTASPRGAIKAMCLECVGWTREEVELCTAKACPLFCYRNDDQD